MIDPVGVIKNVPTKCAHRNYTTHGVFTFEKIDFRTIVIPCIKMADVKILPAIDQPKDTERPSNPNKQDVKQHKYDDYKTMTVRLIAYILGVKVIPVRDASRIKNKNGFVYAFPSSSGFVQQLLDWVHSDLFDYFNGSLATLRGINKDEQNALLEVYLEKRMRAYAEDFGLVKLSAKDLE